MSGLLPPQITMGTDHLFQYIAVSYRGPDHADPRRFHGDLKTDITHHRGHQSILTEASGPLHLKGAHRHHLIAIYNPAPLIHEDHPVCIPIMGYSDISPGFPDNPL